MNDSIDVMLNRFCRIKKRDIELKKGEKGFVCATYGTDAECQEAQCLYSLNAVTRTRVYGSMGDGFFDYTVRREDMDAGEAAAPKLCDLCREPVYAGEAYLLHTETALASNEYLDKVINDWVQEGNISQAEVAQGVSPLLRVRVKESLKGRLTPNPWLVCPSCIRYFPFLHGDGKKDALDQGRRFWEAPDLEGAQFSPRRVERYYRKKNDVATTAEYCGACTETQYMTGVQRLGLLLGTDRGRILWKQASIFLLALMSGIVLPLSQAVARGPGHLLSDLSWMPLAGVFVVYKIFLWISLTASYLIFGRSEFLWILVFTVLSYTVLAGLISLPRSVGDFVMLSGPAFSAYVFISALTLALRWFLSLWAAATSGLFVSGLLTLLFWQIIIKAPQGKLIYGLGADPTRMFWMLMYAVLFGTILTVLNRLSCIYCRAKKVPFSGVV